MKNFLDFNYITNPFTLTLNKLIMPFKIQDYSLLDGQFNTRISPFTYLNFTVTLSTNSTNPRMQYGRLKSSNFVTFLYATL